MNVDRYPPEVLSEDVDDGTMVENLAALGSHVVGHRIVFAERKLRDAWRGKREVLVITLDDGTEVELADTDDCCAYTELENFFLDPTSIDHVITGVGSTNGYTTWHVYADWGDILRLQLGWSCGNPFYYGYGFDIKVVSPPPFPW